jgi:hypothetical protein
VFGIAVILIVEGWWVFDFGRKHAGVDYRAAVQERARLESEVAQLRDQIGELRDQTARLASSRQIDQHANMVVKDTLNRLQQENQDLREELQFYRSIVSPSKGEPGLRVQYFKIDPGTQERVYRYSFTLIHVQEIKQRNRLVKGSVQLTVEGMQGGTPKVLDLVDISSTKESDLRYSMKYFKQFEGDFVLPEGFTPQAIVLKVLPTDNKKDGVQKKIDWPVTTAG